MNAIDAIVRQLERELARVKEQRDLCMEALKSIAACQPEPESCAQKAIYDSQKLEQVDGPEAAA